MNALATVDLVIPVLNEEIELEQNVRKVLAFAKDPRLQSYDLRIVIADNGSTDRTQQIARDLTTRNAGQVAYVRLEERGVGRALKKVWMESTADIVGYFDLDLATDLKHLPDALDALTIQGFDITYGTRLHKKSEVIGRSLKREITSRLYNGLLHLYLGTQFSDGMCGFKFLKRDIFLRLYDAGAVSDVWFFTTELLAVSEWEGFKLYELPIRWTDSPDSRVRIVRLALESMKAMRELKRRKYVKPN
jgi:glycosyltransferase involved in cell wall biosynthesis